MFLPLSDENPRRRVEVPYVTWGIIVLNVGVFLLTAGFQSDRAAFANQLSFGLIPAVIAERAALDPGLALVPSWTTWITHMFMHGGWMHLVGNMLFLWVFADNVEDAMGHLRFLAFYLLCGLIGGAAHTLLHLSSQAPLVGASGAISGVIAAYLMLFPRARVFGLAASVVPVTIPVWLALGAFVALQVYHVLVATGGITAWWAHMGGLIAGAALVGLFKRADIPLFDDRREVAVVVPRLPLPRRDR